MIKPLRDNIVAVMLDDVMRVGLLHLPENYKQNLVQHGRALVLYAGPVAKEQGCEAGCVVHVSENWGEAFTHRGRKMKIGRSRDINGVVEGVRLADEHTYND